MTESERRAAHERALNLATGAFRADVLAAAAALELLDAFDDTDHTLDELSRLIGAPECGLARLLDTCCALGVIAKDKAAYSMPRPVRATLGCGAPADLRTALLQAAGESLRSAAIVSAVRNGGGKPTQRPRALDGIANALAAFADDFVPLLELGGCTRLLDLSDSAGGLASALLRRHPDLSVTVIACQQNAPIAAETLAAAGLAARARILTPDASNEAVGREYDAALLGRMLRTADDAVAARIVAGCRRRLTSGGVLYLVDALLDDDRTAPPFAALLALEMWTAAVPGRVRTRGEITRLLADEGFRDVRDVRLIPPTVVSIVWGRTP